MVRVTEGLAAFPESGRRHLPDLEATRALGAELGSAMHAGDVVILEGPLGAGKTSLTQGLADALQVRGRVTSPTFQLARRHAPTRAGTPGLVHVDAYRLRQDDLEAADEGGGGGSDGSDGAAAGGAGGASQIQQLMDELEVLDLDEYLSTDVVVIEWGSGLGEVLTPRPWLVRMSRDDAADTRTAEWRRAAE